MAERRVVLIGYRGSGKTTQLSLLQNLLNRSGVDTDQLIEDRSHRSIAEIFADCGESGFRAVEEAVIRELPADAGIVSTGGGAVINPTNIAALRRNSLMVYLETSPSVIAGRIAGTNRPSLTGTSPEAEVSAVLSERIQAYRSAADIAIDTSHAPPEETAFEILRFYRQGIGEKNKREEMITAIQGTGIPGHEHDALQTIRSRPEIILYGILGNPCMHSLSPRIWNRLFHEYRIPAHYTWFETPEPGGFLTNAIEAGVRGLSVTIPHKETIIPLLSEVRHDAATIGAVNTVLVQGGKTYGYNTDWKGVYRPLEGAEGEKAVVIGAGGAAAAAVYALGMRGYTTYILNRTIERARNLADRFGAEYGPISKIEGINPDLLVNTTPVGMGKDPSLPVPVSSLQKGMRVFDLVYTPADTPLLRAALERGCYIIPGTEMFVHQLAEQFRLLTGIEVSTNHIREMMP